MAGVEVVDPEDDADSIGVLSLVLERPLALVPAPEDAVDKGLELQRVNDMARNARWPKVGPPSDALLTIEGFLAGFLCGRGGGSTGERGVRGSSSVGDTILVSVVLAIASFMLVLVLGVIGLSNVIGAVGLETESERGGPLAQADFDFKDNGEVEDMVGVVGRDPVAAVVAVASIFLVCGSSAA